MPRHITRIYVRRRYRALGKTTAHVEWSDGSWTEGLAWCTRTFRKGDFGRASEVTYDFGEHMHSLFRRAAREGLKLERETWDA